MILRTKVWNFGIGKIACISIGQYDIAIEILNERFFDFFPKLWHERDSNLHWNDGIEPKQPPGQLDPCLYIYIYAEH